LHAALQKVLGEHIKQAGSLVCSDYLRFDFSHFKALSREEIQKIEDLCNEQIRSNPELRVSEESLDEALASGAKAFFEEKYGDQVRVLRVGEFSIELCGGTHAESLAEAGLFKIVSESSVASGVRRLVAVTGKAAWQHIKEEENLLVDLAEKLKAPRRELLARVDKLLKDRSELQKKLQQKPAAAGPKNLDSLVEDIEGVRVLIDIVDVESTKELRPIADDYKNRLKEGVVILGHKSDGKATVIVSVSKNLAKDFDTRSMVDRLGKAFDGKGGGRPDFAQVGGQNTEALTRENLSAIVKDHIKTLSVIV